MFLNNTSGKTQKYQIKSYRMCNILKLNELKVFNKIFPLWSRSLGSYKKTSQNLYLYGGVEIRNVLN